MSISPRDKTYSQITVFYLAFKRYLSVSCIITDCLAFSIEWVLNTAFRPVILHHRQRVNSRHSKFLNSFEQNEYTVGIFVDLTKTFDLIDYKIRIKKTWVLWDSNILGNTATEQVQPNSNPLQVAFLKAQPYVLCFVDFINVFLNVGTSWEPSYSLMTPTLMQPFHFRNALIKETPITVNWPVTCSNY